MPAELSHFVVECRVCPSSRSNRSIDAWRVFFVSFCPMKLHVESPIVLPGFRRPSRHVRKLYQERIANVLAGTRLPFRSIHDPLFPNLPAFMEQFKYAKEILGLKQALCLEAVLVGQACFYRCM